MDWVKRNNGYVNCYGSIYSFSQFNISNGRPIYDSAQVKFAYFDLDSKNCKTDMQKLHEYYLRKDIRHFIMLSGNGYHVYAFCQPISNLTAGYSVSETLANYQEDISESLGITICNSCRGNLSKVSRIPNTFHIGAKRFSIPICDPYQDHIILSMEPQWNYKVWGSHLIDLSLWKPKPVADPVDIPMLSVNNVEFPPCMLKVIEKENPVFEERMALVAYLNEQFRFGIETISTDDTVRIIDQILDFLSTTVKWKKFSKATSKKYIRYIVKGQCKGYSHRKLGILGLCQHCGV